MNSKSHLSLASILVGLALTLSDFGCGGSSTSPDPLPPAITVAVSPGSAADYVLPALFNIWGFIARNRRR